MANYEANIYGTLFGPPDRELYNVATGLHEHLSQNNASSDAKLNYLSKQMDRLVANPRRKLLQRNLAVQPNDQMVCVDYYDNGTTSCNPFIMNAVGEIKVYDLQLMHYNNLDYFLIQIGKEFFVIGDRRKLSPTNLYRSFISAGVFFNQKFTQAQVGELLYHFFAPIIANPTNTLNMSSLAGWYEGEYYFKDNFYLGHEIHLCRLPVAQKELETQLLQKNDIGNYLNHIACIKDDKAKILLILFPFIGIISSLLAEQKIKNRYSINLVLSEKIDLSCICDLLQVLDRQQLIPFSSDVTYKTLLEKVRNTKDETLIVEVMGHMKTSQYITQKKESCKETLADAYACYKSLNTEINPSVLVMLSDNIFVTETICNIILDDDTFDWEEAERITREKSVMAKVFFSFISFVTNNYLTVKELISGTKSDSDVAAFIATWSVLKAFWKSYDIEMAEIFGTFSIENISDIIEEKIMLDAKDLVDAFINSIRKGVRKYSFVTKKEAKNSDNEIIFDEEFLWFPVNTLRAITRAGGFLDNLTPILLELRAIGIAVCDNKSVTKKLQIAGVRKPYYQLKRAFFNKAGYVDIVELGGTKNEGF